jgi:hypothetical protein
MPENDPPVKQKMPAVSRSVQTTIVMVACLSMSTYLFLHIRPIGGLAILLAGLLMSTEIATGALSVFTFFGSMWGMLPKFPKVK